MSEQKTVWQKMQEVDRRVLYLILLVLTSAGLFIPGRVPVDPDQSSKDLYITLMQLDPTKTMLIESDWTQSTRGENAGHTEALLRLVMNRGIKFVVYTLADPQAPQVFRDVLRRMNDERVANGMEPYRPYEDYIDLGYFPNAEGQANSMANDIRKAWAGKKQKNVAGQELDIWTSPVLKDVRKVGDASLLMIVTASATVDIVVERLYGKVTLACMCTGVTGPGVLPYYQAGQMAGIGIGLKGVYDMEYMLTYGLNVPDKDGKVQVRYPNKSQIRIEPLPMPITFGRGAGYYATLHVALILLILAVALGNLGMFFGRPRKAKAAPEEEA